MDIDPAQTASRFAACSRSTAAQHEVAPRRDLAAVEHAVRKLVLTTADRRLIGLGALGRHPGTQLGLDRRRPVATLRAAAANESLRTRRIHRQWRAKIDEIAIEVRVALVDAAQVREAVRIQVRGASALRRLAAFDRLAGSRIVVQQRDLTA